MQAIRFTNLHQMSPTQHLAIAALINACIGEGTTNENHVCSVAVTLVECDGEFRGIPYGTAKGLEIFIPGSDATLRCDYAGMVYLTFTMEG